MPTRRRAGLDPAGARCAAVPAAALGARSALRCCASARSSATSRSRPTRPTTPSTRCCGGATCCTCTCPTSASTAARPSIRWRSPSACSARSSAQGGARLMVLGSIASFVAAVAGIYRLGRLCFGPVVGRDRGAAAAEPLLRREPRRAGLPGHLLHRADRVGDRARGRTPAPRRAGVRCCSPRAGLLRPDAWVLSGAYWLWCCAGRRATATRLRDLALAAHRAADLGRRSTRS